MNEEILKTYCGNCDKETSHTLEYKAHETEPVEILAKNDKELKTESFWMVGFHLWQISKCKGCEKLTFKHVIRTSSEPGTDIIFNFPKSHIRPLPDWYQKLPLKYLEIIREIYSAINQGAFILALIGVRTILDVYIVEKIGDKGTFKTKLSKLVDGGFITKTRADSLNTIINAGNASAHRGYKPKQKNLFQILDIMDNLLQSEILDREAHYIKEKTPERKK